MLVIFYSRSLFTIRETAVQEKATLQDCIMSTPDCLVLENARLWYDMIRQLRSIGYQLLDSQTLELFCL